MMNGLISYPITLAHGRFARLLLPGDLTRGDVARIVAMLQTLPADPETDPASFDGKGVLQDGSTPERMR
jgi:hypothetical protein